MVTLSKTGRVARVEGPPAFTITIALCGPPVCHVAASSEAEMLRLAAWIYNDSRIAELVALAFQIQDERVM